MGTLTTTVAEVEENKVRVSVTVPAAEFEKAVDAAFRKIAREVKVPGFRPGKAPRAILESRVGLGYAREQALRDALPEYYEQAITAESVDATATPEIEITSGADEGDVAFDAVVEIRPVVTVTGYDALRVEIPSPDVSEEIVDAQLDSLRERFADLTDSDDPLVDGNFAQIDIKGTIDGEPVDALSATDFLYEVGSAMLVEELDAEIRDARPGAILQFTATLDERFGDREGDEVTFDVVVKDAKRKVLPEVTDEWVSEVSEFDAVADLRADIATRMSLMARVQSQMLVRDQVLEAASALVDLEVPKALVDAEMERRLHDLAHRLEPQGVTIPQYLAMTGQDQQAFVDDLREACTQAVRADLALRSVVAQEAIEVADSEVDAEVERLAERMGEKPARVRKDLERRGVIDDLRSDLARGQALRFLIDHAVVVDEAGNVIDLTLPEGDVVAFSESASESEPESESVTSEAMTADTEENSE